MCWGIYLAIPREVGHLPIPGDLPEVDEGFIAWREPNPWISTNFGDQFSCWILGHGRHCSCGCVKTEIDQQVALTETARTYLADIADLHATVGLTVHWTRGSFATEELPFEHATSITASELRGDGCRNFPVDTLIWVQGKRGGVSPPVPPVATSADRPGSARS